MEKRTVGFPGKHVISVGKGRYVQLNMRFLTAFPVLEFGAICLTKCESDPARKTGTAAIC